jgi:RND superfamily putative drug exporter
LIPSWRGVIRKSPAVNGGVTVFRLLGRLVSRLWPLFLIGWLALVFAVRYAAPTWSSVAQDKEFAFLPDNVPSRRAEAVFDKAFPDDRYKSNIVLVLQREGSPALETDLNFIEQTLEPRLRQIAESEGGLAAEPEPSDEPLFSTGPPQPPKATRRSVIARIVTPNAPAGGALLVSADQQVLLVVLDLTTEFLSDASRPTIRKVEELIPKLSEEQALPQGLAITVTGSAVIGRDHSRAQRDSVRATQFLTIALVIVLLMLIYRTPVLAAIPLATVFLGVELAIGVLATFAKAGQIQLFEGI